MQLAPVTASSSVPASSPEEPVRATGVVAFVDPTQRFGIVRPDAAFTGRYAGLEHVFFALSQLEAPVARDMRVSFDVDPAVRDDKGYAHASNVRPA